jgi:L-aspartate oxidase
MARHILTDILVIGSGISGCVAALIASERLPDRHILMITSPDDPHESSTYYAQGGIIGRGPADSPELLAEDIMRAGDYCNDPAAVALLAREGPRLVKEILIRRLGVEFSERTAPNGQEDLEYIKEAAHSTERIVHVADATGKVIEQRAVEAVQARPNITLLTNHTAVDLLTPAHHSRNPQAVYAPLNCVGAYVFDQESGHVIPILARKVILATGGLGRIFLHTTTPPSSRGDGLAMAYRAGARIINAQYIQFHPTAFYRRDTPRFLISEAVRGAGARLLNNRGEAFMERYAPEWKDLAPRDVVARSIHREMLATQAESVFLDLRSAMSPDDIKHHFPTIYARCLEYGVDVTRELIPVVPAAHYFCGGVWVDDRGRSNVANLYAVGEVSATGVHGANRLGSTSLLEGLTWGYRAGNDVAENLGEYNAAPDDIPPWQEEGLTAYPDQALVLQDAIIIQHIMWNYVGLVRSARRLERAIDDLRHLQREIDRFYRSSKLTDGLIGLRNGAQAALIVAQAAWEAKESHGCHYRED